MSIVNNHTLVLADATSTWDTIKNGVVDAANWVGRQAKWVGQSIADFMYKIYEIAKPFFAGVSKFVVDSYHAIKEFFMENKQVSVGALIGLLVGAIAATTVGYLCFGGNKAPETTEDKSKAGTAKA